MLSPPPLRLIQIEAPNMSPCAHTFETLSGELINIILKHMPRPDLVAVALSSRRLLSHVRPVLYGKIEVTRTRSLFGLWRTFSSNSTLALLCLKIRIVFDERLDDVTLDDLRNEFLSNEIHFSGDTATVVEQASNSLVEFGLEACLSYIFSCLENLRTLDVKTLTSNGISQAFNVVTLRSRSEPFQSLINAKIVAKKRHRTHGFFPIDSQNVLAFLYLPQLQRFEVSVFSKDLTLQAPPHTNLSSRLRELVLSPGSCVQLTMLSSILERTPKIEALEYHFTAEWETMGAVIFESSLLSSCLSPIKTTLRRLHISCEFFGDLAGPQWLSNELWGFKGQLTSLEEFTKLQHLTIPLTVLLGYNPSESNALEGKLPANLLNLRVLENCYDWDDFAWEPSELEGPFENSLRRGCLSRLQRLELNAPYDQDWPWITDVVETLQQANQQVRVRVTRSTAER